MLDALLKSMQETLWPHLREPLLNLPNFIQQLDKDDIRKIINTEPYQGLPIVTAFFATSDEAFCAFWDKFEKTLKVEDLHLAAKEGEYQSLDAWWWIGASTMGITLENVAREAAADEKPQAIASLKVTKVCKKFSEQIKLADLCYSYALHPDTPTPLWWAFASAFYGEATFLQYIWDKHANELTAKNMRVLGGFFPLPRVNNLCFMTAGAAKNSKGLLREMLMYFLMQREEFFDDVDLNRASNGILLSELINSIAEEDKVKNIIKELIAMRRELFDAMDCAKHTTIHVVSLTQIANKAYETGFVGAYYIIALFFKEHEFISDAIEAFMKIPPCFYNYHNANCEAVNWLLYEIIKKTKGNIQVKELLKKAFQLANRCSSETKSIFIEQIAFDYVKQLEQNLTTFQTNKILALLQKANVEEVELFQELDIIAVTPAFIEEEKKEAGKEKKEKTLIFSTLTSPLSFRIAAPFMPSWRSTSHSKKAPS